MKRVLGVNGIHNWSTSSNSFTDKLLATLAQDFEVIDIAYPRMWALFAYLQTAKERRADVIAATAKHGDILVAHSFGCLASIYAMRKMAAEPTPRKFSHVFFFGAAAEQDVYIPDCFDKLYNIHSKNDVALKWGDRLPWHDFGLLGHSGYTGGNRKVVNINADGNTHSSYTDYGNICQWKRFIMDPENCPIPSQVKLEPVYVPTAKIPGHL